MDPLIIKLSLILLVVIVLYVTRWIPIEVTSLLIPPTLVFCGLLDPGKALNGFSSSATITIGAMFILSAGLMRTGILEHVTFAMGRWSKGSAFRFLIILALLIPFSSAFMNNTPVVVMMVPVVLALSHKFEVKPSKLMIPLSYFAILGGTCTLVGTSTNILIDELYRAQGGPGFTMFEFSPLGAVFVLCGALFILLLSSKLLPERTSLSAMLPRGRTAKFVTEINIEKDSSLRGLPIRDIFTKDKPIHLLEVVRNEEVTLAPLAKNIELETDDALLIEGTSKNIAEFLSHHGASLSTVVEDNLRVPMKSMELMLGEAVVLPQSPFIGRSVSDLGLNKHYGVKVMAVQRRGRHHRYKIRQMLLKPGDVLLLQAGESGFNALRETEAVLIFEGLEEAILHKRRGILSLAIMVGVIALAAIQPILLPMFAITGAVLMVLTRCLRLDEAIRSLDASVLLLLAGTIPLGIAMTDTGMAAGIVHHTVDIIGTNHPVLILSMLYLLTSIMTQVLSNNATAVLMTPIVIGLATQMGLDPKPLLMAIAFGASASFMSPIGYQTNAIVMGPGGYTFSDYMKIGIPMNILMWGLATLFIPIFWPLLP